MKRDILYVDDEPSNLIVFEAAFDEQFNVITCQSAEEALAYLQDHPVPVVVADQRMPEMTGVEMFVQVRRLYPHTQRVILSGFTDSDAAIASTIHASGSVPGGRGWSSFQLPRRFGNRKSPTGSR